MRCNPTPHTDKVLVLEEFPIDIDAEFYVTACSHDKDMTIHIVGDFHRKGYWKRRLKRYGVIAVISSGLSHESLHNALTASLDDEVSQKLDNLFGHGHSYKKEYHGLCSLDRHLYNAKRKVYKRGNRKD